jgi:hypothetical protein
MAFETDKALVSVYLVSSYNLRDGGFILPPSVSFPPPRPFLFFWLVASDV